MQTLVPQHLPLDQHALIEASAGTGKTYTITTLYLRAVLGLISPNSNQSLTVDQILVVTFTEAATEELKSRIRERLKEAQTAILKWLATPSVEIVADVDPTVLEIIELAYESLSSQKSNVSNNTNVSKDRDIALSIYNKIQQNITLIDEASIFTIHGFCQRVLNQFAFETQMSFEQSFDLDNAPYLNHALQDFWRSRMSNLSGFEYHKVSSLWKSPEQLKKELEKLIDKPINIAPSMTDEAYHNIKRYHYDALNKLWQQLQGSDISEVVQSSQLKKSGPQYKQLETLTQFINNPLGDVPLSASVVEAFTSDSFADQSNYYANKPATSHPQSTAFDACLDYCKKFDGPEVKGYWLEVAKRQVEQGAQAIKQEQQTLTPDDLLLRLEEAVQSPDNQSLLEAIQRRYPLAFIDEFQDTDPIQYAIFRSVYLGTKAQSTLSMADETSDQEDSIYPPTMIMIGDPKQAIYKFRGADINTYITAKTDLESNQHYTLDKNWRSHPKLINAINRMYNNSTYQFGHEAIPFVTVGAGQADSKSLFTTELRSGLVNEREAGECHPLPVLNIQHLTACELNQDRSISDDAKGLSFGEAKLSLARLCAANIKTQLQQSQAGTLLLGKGVAAESAEVEGKDIAVLVRSRYQAKLIKQALRELGVDSVYLSRDSVFDSPLARDTLRLLEAINSPTNEKRVRAAVSTVYFSYLPEYQLALQNEEGQWHRLLATFYRANEFWRQGKITSALQSIIVWADTLNLWQQHGQDFERLVTDLRHLEQLIQEQAAKLPGHEKLLVWYRQAVTEIDRNEELSLRLESDRNLVQIVTMHGSKGLEYPIVYLPFVTEFSKEKVPLYFDESERQLVYRADQRKIDIQKAEKERLDEDIRLLYVAMTRAKFQLHISTFNTLERVNSKDSSIHQSAFGLMVLGQASEKPTDAQWQEHLKAYIDKLNAGDASANVSYQVLTQDDIRARYTEAKAHPYIATDTKLQLSVSAFNGRIDKRWTVLSFSAIAHNSDTDAAHSVTKHQGDEAGLLSKGDVWLPGVSDEISTNYSRIIPDETKPPSATESLAYRFRFPKGANAGSCLHYIYEFLDFTIPVKNQVDVIEKAIAKFGLDNVEINELCDWLQSTLYTPLFDELPNWSLSSLTAGDRLDEMEFYFSYEQLNSDIVSHALQLAGFDKFTYNNALLSGEGLKGRLKGFIDLTCRINGKYYVMDYKSNYLGDDLTDYGLKQIQNSMSDHNYYLQLLIYTYALHRFLKVRLSNYDYQHHVGGGVYLFLRGMTHDEPAGLLPANSINGVFSHRVREEAITYLDNALLCSAKQQELETTHG